MCKWKGSDQGSWRKQQLIKPSDTEGDDVPLTYKVEGLKDPKKYRTVWRRKKRDTRQCGGKPTARNPIRQKSPPEEESEKHFDLPGRNEGEPYCRNYARRGKKPNTATSDEGTTH